MGAAIAAIGVTIGIVGIVGIASPKSLLTALDQLKSSPRKIYGLAVARLLIGVILVAGASSTASPTAVLFIGAAFILRAAMIPLLGGAHSLKKGTNYDTLNRNYGAANCLQRRRS